MRRLFLVFAVFIMLNKLQKYFFRGLLIVAPLGLTIIILTSLYNWIEKKIVGLGLEKTALVAGFALAVFIVLFLGYLASEFLLAKFIDVYIDKIPLVNFLYSSLKDLMDAFVGDKKKFDKPVLVTINKNIGLQKLGFITQNDLSSLGMEGKVAVYLPHSYNFSGNLFVVDKEHVEPLDVSGSDMMKFIVSGGVAKPRGKK